MQHYKCVHEKYVVWCVYICCTSPTTRIRFSPGCSFTLMAISINSPPPSPSKSAPLMSVTTLEVDRALACWPMGLELGQLDVSDSRSKSCKLPRELRVDGVCRLTSDCESVAWGVCSNWTSRLPMVEQRTSIVAMIGVIS